MSLPHDGTNFGIGTLANEFVVKPFPIGLNEAGGRMRKMDRHDVSAGAGDFAEKAPARGRRLRAIPIEDRRPVRLPALQRMMHEIADHNRTLSAGADVHAAMAGRMARR